jgi:hypothetical protein
LNGSFELIRCRSSALHESSLPTTTAVTTVVGPRVDPCKAKAARLSGAEMRLTCSGSKLNRLTSKAPLAPRGEKYFKKSMPLFQNKTKRTVSLLWRRGSSPLWNRGTLSPPHFPFVQARDRTQLVNNGYCCNEVITRESLKKISRLLLRRHDTESKSGRRKLAARSC